MPADRKPIDWERIEAQYRAGVMSLREIAAAHNDAITEAAIRKRAKRDAWERDLSAKVRAKADALVRKAQVRSEVRTETPTEREVVDTEANVLARIELAHRRDIPRARDLVLKLLAEVEMQTAEPALFAELGRALIDDDTEQLKDAFHKVTSLAGRVQNVKALADALKTLITLERQAFRMDVPEEQGKGAGGRQMSDLELASKLAHFVDIGRRRAQEAAAA